MEANSEVQTPEISPEEAAMNDAIAEAQAPEGGLPSEEAGEQAEVSNDKMNFDGMSDEWKEANLKDGKLFGKFDSVEQMAKSYKKLNDERAAKGHESKQEEVEAEANKARSEVSNSQLGEIANNGFEITEDNFKAFEEAGVSRVEAENMAFRMEKAANQAYKEVGGKDEYNAMMVWAESNLTEAEIKTFANDVVGDNFTIKPAGKFAIRGLQAMMKESGGSNSGRISGNTPSNTAMAGYKSKQDYNSDMAYMRKNPADTNAQRAYEAKMKLTDMRNLR